MRLDLRAGKLAQSVAALKRYVGCDVSGDLAKVSAPSAERLSESVALLKAERYDAEAAQLLEATYEEFLALGQYETPYFVKLARLALERADAGRGEKLLRLMVGLADEGTKDEAAAEVTALPGVRERFAALARADVPEQSSHVERAQALRLAAETEASFGRYAEAADFRSKLSGEKPDDYANRVEAARVLAAGGRREEAAAQLASIISDRRAPRAMRWQAVWVAPEITGGRKELWALLAQGLSAGEAAADEEMAVALKARELSAEGHAAEAADIVKRVAKDDPNPLLEFFLGVLSSQSGRIDDAATAFDVALRSQASDELSSAFGAEEESPLRKLIRLHISAGRPLAALKLAALDAELLSSAGGNAGADEGASNIIEAAATRATGFLTLGERARQHGEASALELLGLLSIAAEQVEDYDKAIEFERSRLGRLAGEDERRACRERIARLVALQKEKASAKDAPLVVDRSAVAQS